MEKKFCFDKENCISFNAFMDVVLHSKQNVEAVLQIKVTTNLKNKKTAFELYVFETIKSIKVVKYYVFEFNIQEFIEFFKNNLEGSNWRYENVITEDEEIHIFFTF